MSIKCHPSVRVIGSEERYDPVMCTSLLCYHRTETHYHCPLCPASEIKFHDEVILKAHYRVKHVDKGIPYQGLKILRCCDHCEIIGSIKNNKSFRSCHWHCFKCQNGFNRKDEALKHYRTHFKNPKTAIQIQVSDLNELMRKCDGLTINPQQQNREPWTEENLVLEEEVVVDQDAVNLLQGSSDPASNVLVPGSDSSLLLKLVPFGAEFVVETSNSTSQDSKNNKATPSGFLTPTSPDLNVSGGRAAQISQEIENILSRSLQAVHRPPSPTQHWRAHKRYLESQCEDYQQENERLNAENGRLKQELAAYQRKLGHYKKENLLLRGVAGIEVDSRVHYEDDSSVQYEDDSRVRYAQVLEGDTDDLVVDSDQQAITNSCGDMNVDVIPAGTSEEPILHTSHHTTAPDDASIFVDATYIDNSEFESKFMQPVEKEKKQKVLYQYIAYPQEGRVKKVKYLGEFNGPGLRIIPLHLNNEHEKTSRGGDVSDEVSQPVGYGHELEYQGYVNESLEQSSAIAQNDVELSNITFPPQKKLKFDE